MAAVTDDIRQRSADVIEAARRADLQADDELAVLLGKITNLATAVGDATVVGQGTEILKRLDEIVRSLGTGAGKRENEIKRTMMRAGLIVARQLAVKVERRTAMAIGALGVLIAAIAGYTGYQIGAAGAGPVAACWQQGGKEICTPAVWIGGLPQR